MHFAFIPYGSRQEVELLLRDMEAQKFYLPMRKDKENKQIPIQGTIRQMPLGVYEYIFPKEYLDMVLNTLGEDKNPYGMKGFIFSIIKKFYKLQKVPEYKKEKYFLWIRDNVAIIPLGIREDGETTEDKNTPYEGFIHEEL